MLFLRKGKKMKKNNVVTEIKARIDSLIEDREREVKQIETCVEDSRAKKEAAELAMHEAMESLNVDAYAAAEASRKKAQIEIEMYSKRHEQIIAKEYIPEEDSDKVIDSLLEREQELDAEFEEAVKAPIEALSTLLNEYRSAIREVEETITAWTGRIHANYRSAGTIYANGTNRADHPVEVHTLPYVGSTTAARIDSFIEKYNRGDN